MDKIFTYFGGVKKIRCLFLLGLNCLGLKKKIKKRKDDILNFRIIDMPMGTKIITNHYG